MSGLIDTALGWWKHDEDGRANGNGVSTSGVKRLDPDAAELIVAPKTGGNVTPAAIAVEAARLEVRVEASAAAEPDEAPWLAKLDRLGVPRTLVYPSTTLGRMLDQTADRFGTAPAVIYNHRTWTWADVRERANRLAGGLARLGVRRGERVVMTLPNCPEFVTAFFAVQKLGAVLVNAGPLMGADDLQTVMTMTSPRVVLGLDLQSPILCRAAKDSTVEHYVWVSLAFYQTVFKRIGYQFKLWHERGGEGCGTPEQHVTLEKLLEEAPSRPPTVDPEPEKTAVLQPTGGTTGVLKLVQLSHKNVLCNATQVATLEGARLGQERYLAVLPMFHVYGLTTNLISAAYMASPMVITTRFNATETVELVRRYRPTIFPLVPAMADAISGVIEKTPEGERPTEAFANVRLCISGAAPLPKATAERFERLTGSRIVEGYGLSEAGPVTHVNPPDEPRTGSIGLPLPDTRCRIVDLQHGKHDVPVGECGELLISGPQVMAGYFSNPDGTRASISTDEEGATWLHTGDVVRVDQDGFFFVQDRKKDMIIRSGMKVYAAKVERVLKGHEKVADAAVIGRPDAVHTEEVVAYVVAAGAPPDNRQELVDELRAYCRQHLAPYEVPAKVEFIGALPRSALGKLLKHQLRAMPPLAEMAAKNGNGNGNGHGKVNGNGNGRGAHTEVQ